MNPATAGVGTGYPVPLESPSPLRQRAERLVGRRTAHQRQLKNLEQSLADVANRLELAEPVTEALRELGEQLFAQVLGTVQSRLTVALQDVLEQPVQFRATAEFKRGAAAVEFSIERDGNREDIRRGQGGSVHNILSVGLRMFALASLDPATHRPFLVLDEQDCWLRPELVPALVGIVAEAARELGFQVVMISHHDVRLFEDHADRIWRLVPAADGITVQESSPLPQAVDHG